MNGWILLYNNSGGKKHSTWLKGQCARVTVAGSKVLMNAYNNILKASSKLIASQMGEVMVLFIFTVQKCTA